MTLMLPLIFYNYMYMYSRFYNFVYVSFSVHVPHIIPLCITFTMKSEFASNFVVVY